MKNDQMPPIVSPCESFKSACMSPTQETNFWNHHHNQTLSASDSSNIYESITTSDSNMGADDSNLQSGHLDPNWHWKGGQTIVSTSNPEEMSNETKLIVEEICRNVSTLSLDDLIAGASAQTILGNDGWPQPVQSTSLSDAAQSYSAKSDQPKVIGGDIAEPNCKLFWKDNTPCTVSPTLTPPVDNSTTALSPRQKNQSTSEFKSPLMLSSALDHGRPSLNILIPSTPPRSRRASSVESCSPMSSNAFVSVSLDDSPKMSIIAPSGAESATTASPAVSFDRTSTPSGRISDVFRWRRRRRMSMPDPPTFQKALTPVETPMTASIIEPDEITNLVRSGYQQLGRAPFTGFGQTPQEEDEEISYEPISQHEGTSSSVLTNRTTSTLAEPVPTVEPTHMALSSESEPIKDDAPKGPQIPSVAAHKDSSLSPVPSTACEPCSDTLNSPSASRRSSLASISLSMDDFPSCANEPENLATEPLIFLSYDDLTLQSNAELQSLRNVLIGLIQQQSTVLVEVLELREQARKDQMELNRGIARLVGRAKGLIEHRQKQRRGPML